MNYNRYDRNNSTIGIRLMCAAVFVVFSFCFLYFFQAEAMALAQHVLSGGVTHYNRVAGAVVITLALLLLQLLVFSGIRLWKRFHALTYLPSMLSLAFFTSMNSDMDLNFSTEAWWWAFPLVIILWLPIALLARGYEEIEPKAESSGIFSRRMWVNLLIMALLIIGVVSVSNTNAVFHYRMRMEVRMMNNDFEGALKQGSQSLESDANLQMLRMYALSRTGELGERLFTYPIVANSEAILPVSGASRFALYPVDSLYRFLGAKPVGEMTTSRYLELMQRCDSAVNRRVADYQLCGLLIDKKIDDFARALTVCYAGQDSIDIDALPKHYREAMILYTRLRSRPIMVYHNAVMDEDWRNLQELEADYPDFTERKGKVEEQYRGTYWYYYEYE